MTPHVKLASVTTLAAKPLDQILIKELVLDARIGLFAEEKQAPQPISLDITLDLLPLQHGADHSTDNIVRYDHIIERLGELLSLEHVELIEDLAEDIAALCLTYERVVQADIAVTKLNAFENARGVGVRICRRKG